MNKKICVIIIILVIAILAIIVWGINSKKESGDSNIISVNSANSEGFSIKYNNIEIVPGSEFDETLISKADSFAEIPSCAFDGTDKVYTYSNMEIIVTEIDGIQTIYSVYFIDDTIETNEGVKITDSKDSMIEAYGIEYTNDISSKFVYTKNNVTLSFIVENGVITGIEYTLLV